MDLIPLPTYTKFSWEAEKRAKEIKDLHAQVKERIEKVNSQVMQQVNKYKRGVQFQHGDLVWVYMRKERFPSKCKSKIMPRSDGPFGIVEQIGPNAYKADLYGDYGLSASFNVADLRPYFDEEQEIQSLRSNSNQPGEGDSDHPPNSSNPLRTFPNGPAQLMESSMIKGSQALSETP